MAKGWNVMNVNTDENLRECDNIHNCIEQVSSPSFACVEEQSIHLLLDELNVYRINVPVFISSNQRVESPELRKELNARKLNRKGLMMKLANSDKRVDIEKPSFLIARLLT
jgi:hypothetical protein